MKTKKRIIALALLFSLLFVMLFSAFYIASAANHECIGSECAVCGHIDICKKAFSSFAHLSFCAVMCVFGAYLIVAVTNTISPVCGRDTLVSLKVKLSD